MDRTAPAPIEANWRRPALLGAGVIAATFLGLGGWAATAPVDSAVTASGNVTVESQRKPIQHLEGGIVAHVAARDGERVLEGDVVLRMDDTQARASLEIARNALHSALAEEARLSSEAEGADSVAFPAELSGDEPAIRRAVSDQTRQFGERRAARRNEVLVLQERAAGSVKQADGVRAQLDASRRQIASISAEYDSIKPLADRGLIAVTRINTLDRGRVELVGKVGALEAEIERLERSARESALQVDGVARKFVEEASAKLSETRARLADARDKVRVGTDTLARAEVRSPRTGRIVGLKVFGPRSVVRAGDTLMEVVPEDDRLVVTARISPLDVNHVMEDLDAEVRLPAFKSRTTPLAIGKVVSVGADALKDETTRQPYYDLKVSVQVSAFPAEVREKLKAGMPAEVIVATGERTVAEYLVRPLADAMRLGMREQ
jgi:HlyD family type I secretion membrane fusion protein